MFSSPNNGKDCPQVPSETSPVTIVADVPSVGLQCCGAGSHHVTAVWVAHSTVLRNWKWLVMNGCESRNLNSTALGFLNWCQTVKDASLCFGIMLQNNISVQSVSYI
jgi:hypothetical protein